jgi:hypothetical protein
LAGKVNCVIVGRMLAAPALGNLVDAQLILDERMASQVRNMERTNS